MAKHFRPWNPKQKWLLPPEITEFIPEGHTSHFVRDLVVEQLDLAAILDTYDEERGYPPFHPTMMVALLLYAYTQGSAYAEFAEKTKGKLEPGFDADFILVDRDLYTVAPADILKTNVLQTWVAGQKAYPVSTDN